MPHALASALMTSLMTRLMVSDCTPHQVRAACFGERQFRQALPFGPMPSMPSPPAPPVSPAPSLAAIGVSTAADANTNAHAAASTTTMGAHHDGLITKFGSHNGAALGVWHQRFEVLWARMHAQVSSQQGVAKAELRRRMRQQRHKQRHAFSQSEAAFAQLVARSGGGT